MTSNDSTAAREALIAKQIGRLRRESTILECDGRMNSARVLDEVVEVLAALESPALQPPTRKVRAEVVVLDGERFGLIGGSVYRLDETGSVLYNAIPREALVPLTALHARADADGMVEEGLGQAAKPNSEASGAAVGPSPAPTPTPGSGLDGYAWRREYEADWPSPASRVEDRPDAPSPQADAEKDERYWWLNPKTGECSRHWEDVGSDGIPVVPKSRLDQAERAVEKEIALTCAWENAAQRAGEEMQDAVPSDYFEMSPARWLAWVQDRAMATRNRLNRLAEEFVALTADRDNWQANAERENAMLVTCQEERDEKDRQLTQCYAKLEEALQQRDALAKRVEEGEPCYAYNGAQGWTVAWRLSHYTPQDGVPFTRGRFVADTEDKA